MDPNFQRVLGAQDNNARTILDYLNEDCWHAVLDYVPVYDILHTERTSKRWQKIVLGYLSHARINVVRWTMRFQNNQLALNSNCYSSFKLWTKKLGSAIVKFEKIEDTDDGVEILRKNCPNLEELKISFLKKRLPPNRTEELFPHLKLLFIRMCNNMKDDRLSEFLAHSPALEELKILTDERVTGQCLASLRSTKFKSLVFRDCAGLGLPPLLAVADRLGGLTKLVLARVQSEIRDQVHLLIDKMPKLEYLTVLGNEQYNGKADCFFESVCRLENLKHLSSNLFTWDEHLVAVTRCCKQLEVLKLHCEHVTGCGLAAVCRNVGARLTEADLSHSLVTEDEVVSLIYACPNLTWLRMSLCRLDAEELCPRVAAARREMRATNIIHLTVAEGWTSDDEFEDDQYDPEGLEDVLEAELREYGVYDSDGLENGENLEHVERSIEYIPYYDPHELENDDSD